MRKVEEAWLDVSAIRCPTCGKLYVDASWYVVELSADVECSVCGSTFNTKKNLISRALIRFKVRDDEIIKAEVDKHI